MKTDEIELRIADLAAMVLKAARSILCLMLVLALVFGAYGAYTVVKSASAPKVTEEDVTKAEKAVKTAENTVKRAEKALVSRNEIEIPDAARKVERAKLLVQRRQEYLDNSIYYAMNPFERGISLLTFYVKTDFTVDPDVAGLVEDPRTAIVQAYAQIYPFDSEILDHVRAIMKTNVPKQYIEELISVSTSSSCFVTIQVLYTDVEVAEQVVNYLYETMVSRLKGTVAEHSANVIGTFTGYEVDWDMNDSHTENEDSLINAERAVTEAEDALADLVAGVSDKELAIETAKTKLSTAKSDLEKTRNALENTKVNVKNVTKKAVTFGVVGLVMGLVLGCMVALIHGLFNGRFQNQSEVKSRYTFPLIGVLPRTRKVWFDKVIRKLEGEPVGNFDATANATIQSLLGCIGDRRVCLISSQCVPVAEQLAERTDGQVKVLGSILDSAEAVKELADYDAIVLVEERGKSRADLVDAEVLRANALHKEILGIVLA